MGQLQAIDPVLLVQLIVGAPFAVGVAGLVGLVSSRFESWRGGVLNHSLTYLSVAASFLSLVASVALALLPSDGPTTGRLDILGLKVSLLFDPLSVYFVLLVNSIAFAASWNAISFLEGSYHIPTGEVKADRRRSPVFFNTLVNFFHVTMLAVSLVDNLISLWMAIEATTLVSTLLVSFRNTPSLDKYENQVPVAMRKRWKGAWEALFNRWDKNSWEAAWKYLIITSTGIIFALLGTMFIAHAAEGLAAPPGDPDGLMKWTFLKAHAAQLSPDFVRLSFLFVLVGYGTKAGLAPMHTWLPDGHGEAPPPISALLSGVLLKSALYAILRFYTITNAGLGNRAFTSALLLGAGLFSLLLATPFILKKNAPKQNNSFKRVLAYHSLEHMGIITFGLGIGGSVAIFGALLHTLNHAVTKALMFLSYGNIVRRYQHEALKSGGLPSSLGVKGALRSMPVTSVILTLGGLALVGSPLFNIFLSELIILWGAFDKMKTGSASAWRCVSGGGAGGVSAYDGIGAPFIAGAVVLFVASTTLIFFGLMRHLAARVLGARPGRFEERERLRDLAPLLFLLIFVFVLGVFVPQPLSDLITRSVDVVLGCDGPVR